jgi:hypothetical protein
MSTLPLISTLSVTAQNHVLNKCAVTLITLLLGVNGKYLRESDNVHKDFSVLSMDFHLLPVCFKVENRMLL